MLNKSSSTFRIFRTPVIQSKPDRRRREGAVEEPVLSGAERIPIYFLCHAASGSSHKTLLNSFASVAPFAVKFQISLARIYANFAPAAIEIGGGVVFLTSWARCDDFLNCLIKSVPNFSSLASRVGSN